MAFGLISLLIAVAIAVVWMRQSVTSTHSAVHLNQELQSQTQQIAGRGPDGAPANQSATFEAQGAHGEASADRIAALAATDVKAGGAYQSYFGLQKGDRIIAIDGAKVGQIGSDDQEAVEIQLMQAYQGKKTIQVERGGPRPLTLPLPGAANGKATQGAQP